VTLGVRIAVAGLAATALVVPTVAARTSSTASAAPGHCAPAKHPGGEWRTFGHDLANTRTQPKEKKISRTTAPTLTKAFSVSAADGGGDGDFTGNPIIADGCLFVASTTGWVFAFNADTGAKVWGTQVDKDAAQITSTPNVTDGQVFVAVGRTSKPYVAALDERTGKVKWRTVIDRQNGADAYGSPVVFDGVLFQGVSGGSAELSDEDARYAFQGAYVLLETRGKHAGKILKKVWTVQRPSKNAKQGGATVWSTPAIDVARRVAYVGTGNPFHPQVGAKYADAIIKVDLDRRSPRFGSIIGHYNGTPEEYQTYTDNTPCLDIPGNPAPYYPQGFGACGDLDLDFGASPNLVQRNGKVLVGAGQKSGIYHLINGASMKRVWRSTVGPPSSGGGIVGSTAYDGDAFYGPITIGGYAWSIGAAGGTPRWVAPTGDGAHWGNPVSVANGVMYTVGLTGFLDGYDAATGVPLLHHPMAADVAQGDLAASWGGVSIARNTVYAAIGMTGLPNGSVVAYRPGLGGGATASSAGVNAAAPTDPLVVSGAQAQSYGYLTPLVVVRKGGALSYANFDVVRHNVVQDVAVDHKSLKLAVADKTSWCRQFKRGKCPMFWSKLIGVTQQTPVLGVGKLKAGMYSFYCTLHPGMKGKLRIL
jgi:polyvinyl alcohol dehydrogenase (cytochrome)